jgi:hypothetical protein
VSAPTAVDTDSTFDFDRSTSIWLAASPFAPTWNFRTPAAPAEPSSRLMPLKLVDAEMRVSSLVSSPTSVVIAVRESALF